MGYWQDRCYQITELERIGMFTMIEQLITRKEIFEN